MITLYKYLKGSCMKKGKKSDACTSRGRDVMDRRREQFPKGARRAGTAWWAESGAACLEPARGCQPWPGPWPGGLGRSSLVQVAREAITALTGDGDGCTAGGGRGGTVPCWHRWVTPALRQHRVSQLVLLAQRSRTALGGRAEPDLSRSLCYLIIPKGA